jgi:hypothetical protein
VSQRGERRGGPIAAIPGLGFGFRSAHRNCSEKGGEISPSCTYGGGVMMQGVRGEDHSSRIIFTMAHIGFD